jgi:pimeloyl-ACP methyl ester carboxylesterase
MTDGRTGRKKPAWRRTGAARGRGRRRRRPHRALWALLALSALAAIATILSSRRIHPMEDEEWDDLLDQGAAGRGPFPSVRVRIAGPAGELVVDDGGSGGLPVVFVHALGGSAEQWRAQLEHLRPERRALALELRGHGGSDPAAGGDYGIGAFADDVEAVADDLGLESLVLAGHSLGAAVAAEVAARRPGRVAGLLLVDPSGDQTRAPRAETEAFLRTLRADPGAEFGFYFRQLLIGAAPEVADRVLADLARVEPGTLLAAVESAAGHSPAETLARYPGPKLALITDLNTLPTSLHRLVADLSALPFPGTSHWPMLDRPEEFNRALDEFLARIDTPAEPAG